jgi:hypothetical protein
VEGSSRGLIEVLVGYFSLGTKENHEESQFRIGDVLAEI